jgi:hypothetical protein
MLTMPNNFIRCCFVEAETEWWLVFPHLASDIVTASKLIREALTIFVEDNATNTTEGLSASRMSLDAVTMSLARCGKTSHHSVSASTKQHLMKLFGIVSIILAVES